MKVDYKDNSQQILSALEKGKRNALTAIGSSAETHAKDNITADDLIDTGRLRNSISYAVDGESAYIGTNVEYAPYLELGTSCVKVYYMLQKVVMEYSVEYKRLAEDAVYSAINNSQ